MQKKWYRRPQSSAISRSADHVVGSLFESLENRCFLSAASQSLAVETQAALYEQPLHAKAATTLPVITANNYGNHRAMENGTRRGYIEFSRTGNTSKALTIKVKVWGSASNGKDYQAVSRTLTFEPGKAKAYITVKGLQDTLVERRETVSACVVAGTGYTIGSTNRGNVDIIDDDAPTVSVSAVQNATIAEDSTTPAVFTFTRTGDLAHPVTINYTLRGKAANSTDYVTIAKSVTIRARKTSATVKILPVDDLNIEGDEYVDLRLSGGYYNANGNRAYIKIQDNDVTPSLGQTINYVTFRGPVGTDGSSFILRRPIIDDPSTVATNLSNAMTNLGKAGKDFGVAVSADGQYMLIKTTRFDGDASGSLALVPTNNLAAGQQIVIGASKVTTYDNNIAVANTNTSIIIVYAETVYAGPEVSGSSLVAAVYDKTTKVWTKQVIADATATSKAFNIEPAISADGTKVVFAAGNPTAPGASSALPTQIMEVNTDGTGLRVVADQASVAGAANASATLQFPQYDPTNGDILFSADYSNSSQIWRKAGANPLAVVGDTTNDFCPAVLSDGSVVSLYRDRTDTDDPAITELSLHGAVIQSLLGTAVLPLQTLSVSSLASL
ncbi:MAG: Calx-beta domain-containing protein [Bacillota bacterium]